jgi:hypothetical protein
MQNITNIDKKGVITRGWQILLLNHEELSDLFKVRFEVRKGTDRKINFQKRNAEVTSVNNYYTNDTR